MRLDIEFSSTNPLSNPAPKIILYLLLFGLFQDPWKPLWRPYPKVPKISDFYLDDFDNFLSGSRIWPSIWVISIWKADIAFFRQVEALVEIYGRYFLNYSSESSSGILCLPASIVMICKIFSLLSAPLRYLRLLPIYSSSLNRDVIQFNDFWWYTCRRYMYRKMPVSERGLFSLVDNKLHSKF